MMFCKYCGRKLEIKNGRCKNCGHELDSLADEKGLEPELEYALMNGADGGWTSVTGKLQEELLELRKRTAGYEKESRVCRKLLFVNGAATIILLAALIGNVTGLYQINQQQRTLEESVSQMESLSDKYDEDVEALKSDMEEVKRESGDPTTAYSDLTQQVDDLQRQMRDLLEKYGTSDDEQQNEKTDPPDSLSLNNQNPENSNGVGNTGIPNQYTSSDLQDQGTESQEDSTEEVAEKPYTQYGSQSAPDSGEITESVSSSNGGNLP